MVLRIVSDPAPISTECHGMYLGFRRIADGTYRRRLECEQARAWLHTLSQTVAKSYMLSGKHHRS